MVEDFADDVGPLIVRVASWDRRQPGEPYPWDEVFDSWPGEADAYNLDLALLEAQRFKRAAETVAQRIRQALLTDVQRLGPIRLGDVVYVSVPDRDRRLVDSGGLAAFLGADWHQVVRVTADNVRITTLRELAGRRGLDPKAVESTFFDWVGDENSRRLDPVPISRAPKWAQQLGQGERRGR